MDRRAFLLRASTTAALGLGIAALPPWVRRALAEAPSLIERNAWPEHWETTLAALGRSPQTDARILFARSHFPVPNPDASAYRLEVTGLVDRPLKLDLAALRALPAASRRATLECAGNGRGLFALANTSGTQWERGAVGTCAWSGPSLALLLERAGARAEAKHLWFEASDHATLPQAPPFLRSIPIALARERCLIALAMNGAPLARLHGAPARVVVPGWFGMAWTKWVTKIRVEAAPSDNHFMIKGYRYVAPGGDPLTSPPVDALRVKSLLTRPLEGARVTGPSVDVEGFAWTGGGKGTIKSVDVSGDGGASWQPAALTATDAPYAWQKFHARVAVRAARNGRATLMARATDDAGDVQPLAAPVNTGGYGNNSIHRVTVHV